jgi:hypothetical protein
MRRWWVLIMTIVKVVVYVLMNAHPKLKLLKWSMRLNLGNRREENYA